MKKLLVTCLIVILALFMTTFISAEKSILIDFTKLKANGNGDPANSLTQDSAEMKNYSNHDSKNRTQHMSTLLDYASLAGSSFSAEDLKGMVVSLSCYNWDVYLNSSAAHNENKRDSYCIEWHTKFVKGLEELNKKEGEADPEGLNILGIRIRFPETPYNCWALIAPPFEIPAYENIDVDYKGTKLSAEEIAKPENYGKKFENGYGVIKNVGTIKSIQVRVYGCQFKNSLAALIKDDNNVVTEYMFPQYLDFDGWRTLTWNNPNYIDRASNRDLFIVPLYPRNFPFIKLYSLRIYRQGDQIGGDFVTYIKDIVVTYDKAVLDKENVPIEHEQAWGILQKRTIESRNRELKKIGSNQILRFIEKKKMHQETTSK